MKKMFLLFLSTVILLIMIFPFRRKIERIFSEKRVLRLYKRHSYSSKELSRCLNYRLFSPKLSENKKYPLILVLHGGSKKGTDNKSQLFTSSATVWISRKFQKQHPCFVLAPQCPPGGEWVTIRPKSIPFGHYYQDKFPESEEMKLIISLINKYLKEKPIDPDRVYVVGFSMGATGSWDIMTRHPEIFAASLVVSGETDPTKAPLITHIPIWSFSGELDTIVYPVISQDMANAINKNGGNVKFNLIHGQGHNIESLIFERDDTKEWLFAQVRKSKLKRSYAHF